MMFMFCSKGKSVEEGFIWMFQASRINQSDCQRAQVKFYTKVILWSVISAMGTGILEIVKCNLNEVVYRDITDRRLLSQLREWFSDNDSIYVHDEALFHTAKTTKTHLNNHGNSQDLDPIECLWKVIKHEISQLIRTNTILLIKRLRCDIKKNRNQGKGTPVHSRLAKACCCSDYGCPSY